MLDALSEWPLRAYASARSLHYLAQYHALNALSYLDPATRRDREQLAGPVVWQELDRLLGRDIAAIRQGLYPREVLMPESPLEHFARLPKLLWDGVRIHQRRRSGQAIDFDEEARAYLDDVPAYYRRNFHFQTNGYLSEVSAELYEHQVEMLFGGTADAMRRLIIPPMKAAFGGSDGSGLSFLEIGAGTGRSTRFVQLAFPKARIVALDLSAPYLAVAKRNLSGFPRIDFLQGDGAGTPFQDGRFDAVYSVFLFHELPLGVREQVLAEARRVVVKGGFVGAVDSLQLGDHPPFDRALEDFPRDYHEPFYQNYLRHPLPGLFRAAGLARVESERGFLSKAVWGRG